MDACESSRRPRLTNARIVLLAVGLVVALGLGWLGLQASTVRYRRLMAEQIQADGGITVVGGRSEWSPRKLIRPAETAGISWIREQLGDENITEILYDHPPTGSDYEAIAAFPEADVVRIPVLVQQPQYLPFPIPN